MLGLAESGSDIAHALLVGRGVLQDLQDPHEYVELVSRTAVARYVSLASTVIIVWDWVTNIDAEIGYIWRPRRTAMAGKPLYLFLRYWGLAYQIFDFMVNFGVWSENLLVPFQKSFTTELWLSIAICTACDGCSCAGYFYFIPFGTGPFLYAVDILLAYRALCLFRMNRPLLIVTFTLFFLSLLCTVGTLVMAYKNSVGAVPTPPYLTGCWSNLGNWIGMTAVPGLLFEVWLFAMVVYRMVTYSKKVGRWKQGSVIAMMIMDSVGWFFLITFMLLVNAVGYEVLPIGLRIVTLPTLRSFIIICGCHLILRMRRAYSEEDSFSSDSQTSGGGPKPLEFTPRRSGPGLAASRLAMSPSTIGSITTEEGPSSQKSPLPKKRSVFNLRPSGGEASYSMGAMVRERTKLRRILRLAQRFGMPPPLRQDLDIWDDPVVTLNHGITTESDRDAGCLAAGLNQVSLELGHLPPRTYHTNTIHTRQNLPSTSRWPDAYLDAYSGTDAERSGVTSLPWRVASFFRRGSDNSANSVVRDIEVSPDDSTEIEGDTAHYITTNRWDRLEAPPEPPSRSPTRSSGRELYCR